MTPTITVRRVVSTQMPTRWGAFEIVGFEREILNGSRRVETALAIVLGDLTEGAPLCRIHSECFTSEVLGSLRCDCNDQLHFAMRAIAKEGRGLVIYEHQEGRGIGLMAKLQAYALQDAGLDTIDANRALGFPADYRDFSLPAAILQTWHQSRSPAFEQSRKGRVPRSRLASRSLIRFPAKCSRIRSPWLTCGPKKTGWDTRSALIGQSPLDECNRTIARSIRQQEPTRNSNLRSIEVALDELRAGA